MIPPRDHLEEHEMVNAIAATSAYLNEHLPYMSHCTWFCDSTT